MARMIVGVSAVLFVARKTMIMIVALAHMGMFMAVFVTMLMTVIMTMFMFMLLVAMLVLVRVVVCMAMIVLVLVLMFTTGHGCSPLPGNDSCNSPNSVGKAGRGAPAIRRFLSWTL